MIVTPIFASCGEDYPVEPLKRKRIRNLVEEFDNSMCTAYKLTFAPGDYKNIRSAYASFYNAVNCIGRKHAIQIRIHKEESCMYLIKKGPGGI